MYHTVPGLEHVKIVRNAYAIEYDCINPRQLYPSLEFKEISGLFSGCLLYTSVCIVIRDRENGLADNIL